MIAVEQRELQAAPLEARPLKPRLVARPRRRTPWHLQISAGILVVAVISSLGGGGLLDSASSYVLQAQAQSLHARWAYMRLNGIPDADFATLERQWAQTEATVVVGAGGVFWLPGGADTIARWRAETDAIWSRDLSQFRGEAVVAEQSLHRALAPEAVIQRKLRQEAFAQAVTPLDFATLRDDWTMEARLVPIDRRIAAVASGVIGQTQQAGRLGIRSDPAADLLTSANAYSLLGAQQRLAHAEL